MNVVVEDVAEAVAEVVAEPESPQFSPGGAAATAATEPEVVAEPTYRDVQDLTATQDFPAIRDLPPTTAGPASDPGASSSFDFPPMTAGSPFETDPDRAAAADSGLGSGGFPAGYTRPDEDSDGYPAGYAAPAPPSMTSVGDQSGSRAGVSGAFATLPGIAPDPEPGFATPPSFDVKSDSGSFDVPSGFAAAGAPGAPGAFAPQGVPAQRPEPPVEKLPPPTGSALRITLVKPDGKPFDGPVITTGVAPAGPAPESPAAADAPWEQRQQARPQASKRAGQSGNQGQGYQAKVRKPAIVHIIAVLVISALGIVPLALMMMSGIQTREDKLALTIKVPTKMNYLDTTAIGYLAGMVVVLLGVTVVYRMVLARRR